MPGHSVDETLENRCQSVFLVVGEPIEIRRRELKDKPVGIIEYTGRLQSMASAIRCGLQRITNSINRPDSVFMNVKKRK